MCDEVGDDVDLMNSSLDDLWDTLDDGAELVSCENIGGLYRSVVFEELCGELPRGLMALLVSCVLLFLLLLLLVRALWSVLALHMCVVRTHSLLNVLSFVQPFVAWVRVCTLCCGRRRIRRGCPRIRGYFVRDVNPTPPRPLSEENG